MRAGNFALDVVAGLAAQFIAVPARMKTGARKRIFDEIGSGVELWIMPHISLANFSGELLHIETELITQGHFINRQLRCV